MKTYKRNQVEEALSRLLDAQSGKSRIELLGRVKRLLDTDRRLGADKRSIFAFSEGPPGTSGIEVQFSDYEAFALLVGLRMLDSGWPQSFVVTLLQQDRKKLEAAYRKLLKDGAYPQKRAKPKSAELALPEGAYVVVHSTGEHKRMNLEPIKMFLTSDPQEVMRSMIRTPGESTTVLPLGGCAHQLLDFLGETLPRRRGRA